MAEPATKPRLKKTFGSDFRRFFTRGLAALLPTLITVAVLFWAFNFLWGNLGQYLIEAVKWGWYGFARLTNDDTINSSYIREYWKPEYLRSKIVGVLLAVVVIYFVGLLIGNLIGRTFWRLLEGTALRVPLVKAIYPSVKQITDFLLSDREGQFQGTAVVAIRPRESEMWMLGLQTGPGPKSVSAEADGDTVCVFLPSTPMPFTGWVMVVPTSRVIELNMTVEEAMRLFVSGGVIMPDSADTWPSKPLPKAAPIIVPQPRG